MSEKANVPAVMDPYAAHQDNMPAPTQGNPMALARLSPVGRIVLDEQGSFLNMALAAGLNPAEMALQLASAVNRNADILKCTPASIQGFMLDAAKLRLTIGRGVYPVPIPSKKGTPNEEWRLEAWVGYKGAKELAMRSGSIRDCWATVVFEGDDYADTLVPIPAVTRHNYGPNRGDMSKALRVYATLMYPGGRTRVKVFERAKIESYRKLNPTSEWKTSPWVKNAEEMWCAKAILHTVGDLPHSSPELAHLAQMVEREEQAALAAPAMPSLPRPAEDAFDGPDFDEEPAATYVIEDTPRVMPLEDALAVQVKGKGGQRQPLAEVRNSGLEAWLDWARTKLNEDPESVSLQRIATACARVLDARRAGEHPEPAKAEAA